MTVYDFAPDLDLSKEGRFYFWGERDRRQCIC